MIGDPNALDEPNALDVPNVPNVPNVSMRQLLQCPICHDMLVNPVTIICNHTYCRACIDSIQIDDMVARRRCPICRVSFWLPPNSINPMIADMVRAVYGSAQYDARVTEQRDRELDRDLATRVREETRRELWREIWQNPSRSYGDAANGSHPDNARANGLRPDGSHPDGSHPDGSHDRASSQGSMIAGILDRLTRENIVTTCICVVSITLCVRVSQIS